MREKLSLNRFLRRRPTCCKSSPTVFDRPIRTSAKGKGLSAKYLRFALCASLFALCWDSRERGFAADTQNADAIVDSLQKNYDATIDFTADFRQETEVKALNRNLKAWGKLSFKRPGKMLWRYEEPKGQFVLADGKNLYFYQPEQNQVIKSPLKNAFRSDIPLSFLLGIGNLKRDFNATLKSTDENQHVLSLEPKGDWGGFSEVLVGVSRTTSDILWVSIRDAASNVTSIR